MYLLPFDDNRISLGDAYVGFGRVHAFHTLALTEPELYLFDVIEL